MNEYMQVLQKYAVFSGRAGRREYWMFFLINLIICIVGSGILGIIGAIIHLNIVFLMHLYSLAVLCPGIAVAVRRLHDTNRSGLWLLLSFVPFIGGIIILVFMCQGGTTGDNTFGSDPKLIPTTS